MAHPSWHGLQQGRGFGDRPGRAYGQTGGPSAGRPQEPTNTIFIGVKVAPGHTIDSARYVQALRRYGQVRRIKHLTKPIASGSSALVANIFVSFSGAREAQEAVTGVTRGDLAEELDRNLKCYLGRENWEPSGPAESAVVAAGGVVGLDDATASGALSKAEQCALYIARAQGSSDDILRTLQLYGVVAQLRGKPAGETIAWYSNPADAQRARAALEGPARPLGIVIVGLHKGALRDLEVLQTAGLVNTIQILTPLHVVGHPAGMKGVLVNACQQFGTVTRVTTNPSNAGEPTPNWFVSFSSAAEAADAVRGTFDGRMAQALDPRIRVRPGRMDWHPINDACATAVANGLVVGLDVDGDGRPVDQEGDANAAAAKSPAPPPMPPPMPVDDDGDSEYVQADARGATVPAIPRPRRDHPPATCKTATHHSRRQRVP